VAYIVRDSNKTQSPRSSRRIIYLRRKDKSAAMETVRDLFLELPRSFRSHKERPIRDSNPCRRRERAVS
jgi:hypothetical protein